MSIVAQPKEETPELAYPGTVIGAYVLFIVGGYLLLARNGEPVTLVSAWVPSHLGQTIGLVLWPRFYAISIRQSVNLLTGAPIGSLWSAANRWLDGNKLYYFSGLLYLGFTILTTWLIIALPGQL